MINYKINSGPDSQLLAEHLYKSGFWWLQIRRHVQFNSWKENYEKTNGLKKIETIQEQIRNCHFSPILATVGHVTIMEKWYKSKYDKLKQIASDLET